MQVQEVVATLRPSKWVSCDLHHDLILESAVPASLREPADMSAFTQLAQLSVQLLRKSSLASWDLPLIEWFAASAPTLLLPIRVAALPVHFRTSHFSHFSTSYLQWRLNGLLPSPCKDQCQKRLGLRSMQEPGPQLIPSIPPAFLHWVFLTLSVPWILQLKEKQWLPGSQTPCDNLLPS